VSDYAPVYEHTRGETVESVQFGAVAAVDLHGQLIAYCGNPQAITFLRSSAKPFQVLPFLEAGGQHAYNLSLEEVAIMCASHAGTDRHVAIVEALQAKVGIKEGDLMCGVHPPPDQDTAAALDRRGEKPTPNRHNCSGKHSGMLAFAKMRDWPLEDYINNDHPVQRQILRTFAEMMDLAEDEIRLGIDGCSAPNFAIPLYHAALGYARLADPQVFSPERAAACRLITQAMQTHPELVSGPGRFDSQLMRASGGKLVAKGGAAGYYGLGLLPSALGADSLAVGVALKISDGDARRKARPAVVLEVLRQLNALEDAELKALETFGPCDSLENWRKVNIGSSRPCFRLIR
jgi:L-asparaginase II